MPEPIIKVEKISKTYHLGGVSLILTFMITRQKLLTAIWGK